MTTNSKNIVVSIVISIAFVVVGIGIGFLLDSGQDKVKTQTVTKYETKEVVKEVEISRRDESTRACVSNGGVPTYSAWDGTLNGCIFVGQSTRDTNYGN